MLLLLSDINGDKETLKQIVGNTFKGFQILSNPTKKHDNNFLEKIDQIPLYRNKSILYSELLKDAFKEIANSKKDIILSIDKLDIIKLQSVGLSNKSLDIKVQLYKESVQKLYAYIRNKADFGMLNVIKLFLESIEHLTNILESLKALIPGLEALIELLKVLKNLLFLLEKEKNQ